MSASVYWEPIKKNVTGLGLGGPSRFLETMRETFGGDGASWDLDIGAIPRLRAMASVEAHSFNGERDNAFAALADALEENDHIRVWAEW